MIPICLSSSCSMPSGSMMFLSSRVAVKVLGIRLSDGWLHMEYVISYSKCDLKGIVLMTTE